MKNKIDITYFENIFKPYFDDYYANNRNVRLVNYHVLNNDKNKIIGYCAELQYKNFTQYIKVSFNEIADSVVSSVFKFISSQGEFLCHFVDVLDYYESDDISFYSYAQMYSKEEIEQAFDYIMEATNKYWQKLNDVALSVDICDNIFSYVYDDDTMENIKKYNLDKVEYAFDFQYAHYELMGDRKDFIKEILKLEKKGKLETKFEKRAFPVLQKEKLGEYKGGHFKPDTKTKSMENKITIICFIIACVFAVACGIVGYKLDSTILSDWVGRNHFESALGFVLAGLFIGLSLLAIIPDKALKPFLSKEKYESFLIASELQRLPKWAEVATVVVALAISAVAICFTLNGVGMDKNGNLLYKHFAFSQTEVYTLEETDIAIVKGYESKGYTDYGETAYAFYINDSWEDLGIPSDENKEYIENAIKKYNKNVKTYKTVNDIPQKN